MADEGRLVRFPKPGDALSCGRHTAVWLAIGTLVTAWITSAVLAGWYLGEMRSDISAMVAEWHDWRTQQYAEVQTMTATLQSLQTEVATLREMTLENQAALAQERQERRQQYQSVRH